MNKFIRVLSIIAIVWGFLALINGFFLIYITVSVLFSDDSIYAEDAVVVFGLIELIQVIGMVMLMSFLQSFWMLAQTKNRN